MNRRKVAAAAAATVLMVACSASNKPSRLTMRIEPQTVVFTRTTPPPVVAASDGPAPHAMTTPPPPDPRMFAGSWTVQLAETSGQEAAVTKLQGTLVSATRRADVNEVLALTPSLLKSLPLVTVPGRGTAEYRQGGYAYPDTTELNRLFVTAEVKDATGTTQTLSAVADVVFRERQ